MKKIRVTWTETTVMKAVLLVDDGFEFDEDIDEYPEDIDDQLADFTPDECDEYAVTDRGVISVEEVA